MGRALTLTPHLDSETLKKRYLTSKTPGEARRWHFLWLLSGNHPLPEACSLVSFSPSGGRKLLHRYNLLGPQAVKDGRSLNKSPRGTPPKLSPSQLLKLSLALDSPPSDGGLWTGRKVALWIASCTGSEHIWPQLGWLYLKKLKLRQRAPRPQHKNADPKAQADFKKNS